MGYGMVNEQGGMHPGMLASGNNYLFTNDLLSFLLGREGRLRIRVQGDNKQQCILFRVLICQTIMWQKKNDVKPLTFIVLLQGFVLSLMVSLC